MAGGNRERDWGGRRFPGECVGVELMDGEPELAGISPVRSWSVAKVHRYVVPVYDFRYIVNDDDPRVRGKKKLMIHIYPL